MRVVTWNMGANTRPAEYHPVAWDSLFRQMRPDIAFLQEARVPRALTSSAGSYTATPAKSGTKWGSVIVTRAELRLRTLSLRNTSLAAFEGRLTCGVAETPLGKTLLASVHPGTGHVAESYLQGFDLRAARRPSAPEAYYTDLIFLGLEELRAMYHCPFIFGGDWMESLLLPGWKRRTRDFFDRASGHGWVDTTHRLHGEGHEMRTWCKPGQRPYQNDRIHVDASTAHNLVSCQASDCRDIADISDHAPVLVVLST